MKGYLLIILILSSAISCTNKSSQNKGRLLARVGNARLYEKDLKIAIANNEDSNTIKKTLVNDWVKNQVIYNKALSGLNSDEKNKDKELKDYYESLIRYAYLEKEASARIDVSVSDKDIEDYYAGNEKNFELKRNIIRFLYVKVPVETPVNKNVETWMRHPERKNMDSLKGFTRKYSRNSLLDTGKWYYFSDITKEIPILEDYNPEHFIKANDYVELRDSRYVYMMNIVDGRIKDEIAPLPLVKDKIRMIIINRRKINKIKELENNIYRDAESRRQFEIY
jgi:hypothetical protein